MDPAFAIAASALNAQDTEISVTSENIANAQTPGYATETANLDTLPGGEDGIGGGVEVASITQSSNTMLASNNMQAQGALSNLTSLQQVLSAIQNVFPIGQSTSSSTSSTTANTGLAGQLANFWNAWDSIAQDPTGSAAQSQVVDLAQGLASTLQEGSTQLDQISQNSVTQLSNDTTQINSLLKQVAQLNGSIDQISGTGQNANSVDDELHSVVTQLAQLAGVSVNYGSNNTASVSINGVNLVSDTIAQNVTMADNSGTYGLTAGSDNVPLSLTSGSVAGVIAGINQYVPQYQGDLNTVADSLISTVNSQLAAGFTSTGATGGPLFTGTDAASIGIVSAVANNPSLLAVASTSGSAAANDGSNAQAMAENASSQTGPDAKYQNLIQSIGSVNENINTQVSAQGAVATQAQAALSSATGVNLDAELTNLMQFQANYQASAKLLNVIDSTLQSLISAV